MSAITRITRVGKISILENKIVKVEGASNIEITVEDLYENDKVFNELLKNSKFLFLTILGVNTTISIEAEKYFTDKNRSSIKLAEALVTSQLHHRLIALRLTKHLNTNYPIKSFASETEATKWLLSLDA